MSSISENLPEEVKKYFWGDDLSRLSWAEHRMYISQTLLEKGDGASLVWLLKKITREELLKLLPTLKLSQKSRNFWQVYLA